MSRRRRRRRGRGLWFLACGVVLTIAVYWRWAANLQPSSDPHVFVTPPAPVRAASVREPELPVFPHSVIPGGARSAAELTRALDRDPVAAAHYRGFRSSAARLDHLERACLAYVSYRVADTVFWTRKPVALAAGEAVLTDGENLVRARCGNRISFTARAPTGPNVDLDAPEVQAAGERDAADRMRDGFDLPLIVHEVFPPYLVDALTGIAGGAGATGGWGFAGGAGGLGGSGGSPGGVPLPVRDPAPGVYLAVDPGGRPVVDLPPVLVSYPGPVFVWTGVFVLPGTGVTVIPFGLSGITPPGGALPITILPGGTFTTGENHTGENHGSGGGGGGNPRSTPPGGPGPPKDPIPPPPLLPLPQPPVAEIKTESDLPEPATALLFIAGVLGLVIRWRLYR